jgi:predicted MPP superfamily phosphohydrolase
MAHQPVLADDARENGVDLQLSGHTHGGMMWGLNQLVATMNRGLVSGMYDREPLTVYVSNGTCLWNGFPVRLGVPAELLLITAERRSSK